jgi:hypothetical protein
MCLLRPFGADEATGAVQGVELLRAPKSLRYLMAECLAAEHTI